MKDLVELRKKDIELAKKLVKESVNTDLFIINSINNIEELQKITNILSKRLREWYSLYQPELEKQTPDHEEFVKLVMSEKKIDSKMGANLAKSDLEPILSMAKHIYELFEESKKLELYLDLAMKEHCINFYTLAGSLVGARLLRDAGSLKDLATMRSSTIQLLGAEKALFRHIKTGAKPPKYGFLLQHALVQKSRNKGMTARSLADKLSIASRVDFFKGEFVADRLLKEVRV